MPSKKQQSRKNQGAKPMAEVTKQEDDGFSIIMKSNSNTRSNKVKAEPVPEPARVIPDWERVGMTQEDFEEAMKRVWKTSQEYATKQYHANILADMDSVSYWNNRIETLERFRERHNKMAAWSAEVIQAVDDIDAEIAECEAEIDRIENEQWENMVVEGY